VDAARRGSSSGAFVRRAGIGLLTLWAAITATFFALRLAAGDPTDNMLAQGLATAEQAQALRASLGLDRPLLVQYVDYLADLARGDLGNSLLTRRSVVQVIGEQAWATVELALAGLVVAAVIGGLLGVAAGWTGNHPVGRLSAGLAGLATAVPVAVTGVLLLLAATWLSRARPEVLVATRSGNLALPALALGLASAGALARVLQSGLEESRQAPFLLAARARGVGGGARLVWHALRPALPLAISFVALEASLLLGGTVVTETVFARPGLGRLLVTSILGGDFPVVQGLVLLGATVYTLTHVAAETVSARIDPRLHASAETAE
jgi:peptide/nickel transport system permease protein